MPSPAPEPATTTVTAPDEGKDNPKLLLQRMTRAVRSTLGGTEDSANRVSPEKLEATFRQEPLLQNGCFMHAGDLVKNGFTIVDQDGNEHPDNKVIQAWFRDTFWSPRAMEALIGCHMHGDGFLEIEWNDAKPGEQAPPASAVPIAVHVVDPTTCDLQAFQDRDGSTKDRLVQRVAGEADVVLHPDRFHHLVLKKLPRYKRGLSTVEAAFHAALAKIKGDQGSGELVFYAGHGKPLFTVKNGSDGELEAVVQMVNSRDFTRAYVWTDKLSATELNPTVLDPASFYAAWEKSVAAAIGMPSMLLTGAQAGAVVGSETNLAHYFGILHQVQRNVLEPLVVRLVVGLTGLKPGSFDVEWASFDMGEAANAAAVREKATAFSLLVGNNVKPLAAARLVGLDLNEDDLDEPPAGFLPPVAGAPPQPGQPAEPPAQDGEGEQPEGQPAPDGATPDQG